MHKRVRLVAIDLDGTLLDRNGTLSAEHLYACREASRNCIIAIATGRGPKKARMILREFDFPHYIISHSGGQTEQRPAGIVIQRCFLDSQTLKEVVSIFVAEKICCLLFGRENEAGTITVVTGDNIHPALKDYLGRRRKEIICRIRPAAPLPSDIHLVTSLGEPEELERLQLQMTGKISNRVNSHVVRNITCNGAVLDVLPCNVSKWKAIRKLAAEIGINENEIATIGDDDNDIEMLENAAVSVAMGNSRDSIRKRAMYTTKRNDKDGVAHALKHILRLY